MNQRILGIDIGERRIGLAISDTLGLFAHPFKTIIWKGFETFVKEITEIIASERIIKIVIGVPFTMRGSASAKTEEVKALIELLRQKINIEIIEVDERLTTRMAEKAYQALGKKPSKNRDRIDQVAAAYILQSFLDRFQSNIQGG